MKDVGSTTSFHAHGAVARKDAHKRCLDVACEASRAIWTSGERRTKYANGGQNKQGNTCVSLKRDASTSAAERTPYRRRRRGKKQNVSGRANRPQPANDKKTKLTRTKTQEQGGRNDATTAQSASEINRKHMGPVGIFYSASMHVLTSAVAISSSSMREDDKASVILYILV